MFAVCPILFSSAFLLTSRSESKSGKFMNFLCSLGAEFVFMPLYGEETNFFTVCTKIRNPIQDTT